jgi:hypothetical protein
LFFLRRGKDRDNGRSRKVWDKTEDWDLGDESSLFHCLICERITQASKFTPFWGPGTWTMLFLWVVLDSLVFVELIPHAPSLDPAVD